ncbi:CAP domain-containing protein [Flavimaricola marinus]|uniref:Cysteine-rich secretory protein family protein n=1 Tax=Flavimaricola marinus TaxID=1819565 RepID=A0A238LG19_9RHOB|nr:CAP domain-containing protein [Flavimaricola marinus]SMY08558.1 Cysteine-rich secretory protein family protein [Flavimaricola marinus]
MRTWSLLALPLLSACAAAGVANPVQTTVLGTSAVSDSANIAPLPAAPDNLGHESFGILLNDTRGGFDVLPVTENDLLNEAATLHAQDMVENDYLSHTSLDGRTVGDRVLEVGYNYSFVAENIAQGFSDQDTVVDAWMGSPGHRNNILDPRAVEFGIAQEDSTWVLLLGAQ